MEPTGVLVPKPLCSPSRQAHPLVLANPQRGKRAWSPEAPFVHRARLVYPWPPTPLPGSPLRARGTRWGVLSVNHRKSGVTELQAHLPPPTLPAPDPMPLPCQAVQSPQRQQPRH